MTEERVINIFEKIKFIIKKILGAYFGKQLLIGRHREPIPNKAAEEKFALKPYWILYAKTLLSSFKHKKTFKKIKTVTIFIGYSRSGHSLVGSLLDAHPNIIIAHEVDILSLLKRGFSQNQIFSYILNQSKRFAKIGRGWSKYSYQVPGGMQGTCDKLLIIGDKHASTTTLRIRGNFALLNLFEQRVAINKKYIHHIRNTYDNIGSMTRNSGKDRVSLETVERYFNLCDTVVRIKEYVEKESVFEGRHEDLINDPRDYLQNLCLFLGVDCCEHYLESCAKIIKKDPHKSRNDVLWDKETIDSVQQKISEFDFLKGYSFEDK